MKNGVTNATRPVGPSMRRDGADGVEGKGCALPLGKKILKINILRWVFRPLFFHNFCCFNELENAALKACLNEY